MPNPPPSPLHPLLAEINLAATKGLPFLAVAMTVALPDICVSLETASGRSDGEKYRNWCRDNLGSEFSYVTPEDLWSMRCGVLHNGRFGDLKHSVGRVIFAIPGQGSWTNCTLNDAYFYGVEEFCRNFTQAVATWFQKNATNPVVQTNLPKLMQYRPNGLSPYVVGMPVLA